MAAASTWRSITAVFGGRASAGIEDLTAALNVLVEAAPDAIQLSPGSARLLQERPGPQACACTAHGRRQRLRADGRRRGRYFSELVPEAVEQAVRLDAACVVVNLLWIDGREDLHRACGTSALSRHAASRPGCRSWSNRSR